MKAPTNRSTKPVENHCCHRAVLFLCIMLPGILTGQIEKRVFEKADTTQRLIQGLIQDAVTHNPLGSCSVSRAKTASGTTSDADGKFRFLIPSTPPRLVLYIALTGYITDSMLINAGQDEYSIFLKPLPGSLKEVVIEAPSTRETQLKDDPQTILSVTTAALLQTTESNLIDVLVQNVPGMSAVKTGPNVSKPFIHGLGYNRIETTYDGVPIEGQLFEDEEVLPVDMYNIGKAEVILGPTTLLYGPDALAGLISLIPSLPTDTDRLIHGCAYSEYQSNNGLIGNGLHLSYGNGHWAYEVRGAYRIARDYTNSIDGRVYDTRFREGNASATAVRTVKQGYTTLNFTLYDNSQGIPDGSRDSLTRQFTKQVYDDPFDNIKNRPVVSAQELNSYQLSNLYQHIQHYRLYSTNHYTLADSGSVEAMLAFQENVRREYDFPQLPTQPGVSMRLSSINYDFRYFVPKKTDFETSLGINGLYQNNTNVDAADIPIPNYNLFDIGGFIFEKLNLDRMTISGGYRYDARFVGGNNFYVRTDTLAQTVRQVSLPDTAGAKLLFPAFHKVFRGMSLDLGAVFTVNPHLILKANVSRGSGAPNVVEFAANGLDASAHAYFIGDKSILPETSWQEDAGMMLKYPSFAFSVNVFNNNMGSYTYLIEQVNANGTPLELVPGNKTYRYVQSVAQIYGLESGLSLHPAAVKGFRITSDFCLTDGYNRSAFYRGKGVEGEYLPLVPPMKLLTAMMQDVHTKSKRFTLITLRAEIDMNAAQNRYLALNHTETPTPGYTLLNAGINLTIHYTRKATLHFQVQVNNILDKAYQSSLSRLKYFENYTYSPSGYYGIYEMGRNIGVKLIVPF